MSIFSDAAGLLHDAMKDIFGQGRSAWFPATRSDTTYTVEVAIAEAPVTGKAASLAGLTTLGTDAIIVHATKADLPFTPRAEDLFIIGTTAADISIDTIRNSVTPAGGAMLRSACPTAQDPIETTPKIDRSCPRVEGNACALSQLSVARIMPA